MSLTFEKERTLHEAYPRRVYKPSKEANLNDVAVKGLHFGQRKLLLSEVEFLSAVLEASDTRGDLPILVVYAGAANGSHLPFLFSLFPQVRFVLIDPANFCPEVCQIAEADDGPVVELIQDYCTDELCLRLARMYGEQYRIYLVSDIRSGVPNKMMSNREHTTMMNRDNAWQKSWCWSLRAEAAMLKFHPPYPPVKEVASPRYEPDDDTPETIEYLDGTQLFGVWSPKSSSEVRLVVQGPFREEVPPKLCVYNCQEHEEQCYHYNTSDRYQTDCKAEENILSRFLNLFPNKFPNVEELSRTISEQLRYPLFTPLAPEFTEDTARWMYLMSTTRLPDQAALFHAWKEEMTFAVVRSLVQSYKDSEVVPLDATAGGKALDAQFWKAFVRGDFPEAYSFPRIRWAFFRHTSTDRKKKRQGSKRQRE